MAARLPRALRRRAVLLAALVAAGAALAGCRVAPPEPEDWLAVGFRSPREAFRTFQTALAADMPDLEYRALSRDYKEREKITSLSYREYRERLLDEAPWLRYAANAKVVSVEDLEPGRVRLVARVRMPFVDESFAVELVSEEFYEYWSGDERVFDDWFPFRLAEFRSEDQQPSSLVLTLPWPAAVDPARVTEVRAGREWKIDDLHRIEEPIPSP